MSLWLRTLLRHPVQFAIMTLGIALGVAVMVGIDLANASAARAFEISTNAISGRATHAIIGSAGDVDEAVYVRLRTDSRWRGSFESAPLVIAYAASPQLGEVPFTVLGIDPFAEAPFRGYLSAGRQPAPETIAALLTVPRTILLSATTAERYGLEPCSASVLRDELSMDASSGSSSIDASSAVSSSAGSSPTEACRLTLSIHGEQRSVYLAGLLEPADDFSRRALETLMLTDIATAQSLTGTRGKLTQIDLILPEGFDSAALIAALPDGVRLVSSETRSGQVQEMTAAFRINLTALSLLALVVGVFLIYNAMTFSVVQRRALFGTLRSIGYTREQVMGMVIGEAALVGVLGTALGLILGILLGQAAVRMVTQTINDLYFVVSVRGVQIPASSLVKGALAGFFASVVAAAAPAWEAASVVPSLAFSRAHLESKTQLLVNKVAGLGTSAVLLGAIVLAIPTRDLVVSFSGTSAVMLGLAMLTPWVTVTLMRSLGKPLDRLFGLLGRLAPRNLIRSQSRTAVAAAALMIAVSVTIGVQVMIASFRTTVTIWLEQLLRGDVYISAQGVSETRPDVPLDPQVIAIAQGYPLAQSTIAIRVVSAESERGTVELVAVNTERPMDERLFLKAEGSPAQAWQRLKEGAVLLSEPLANRFGISTPGGSLALLTPEGWRSFPIAGIYADYASTRGTVRMSLDVYRSLWHDDHINSLALILAPGADVDAATADLRAQLAEYPTIQVNPSGELRKDALVIFDRTFAITAAMQLITTLVAFIGVLSSLLALQLEKAREIGILRALGLTVTEMRHLTLWETGLLGASAGLSALPTGYILAWILIFIINQRSFGWTLQMYATPVPFIQAFILAVSAALLAAVYPAWRLGRMQAAEALRGE